MWRIDFSFFPRKVDSRRFSDKGAESGFINFYVLIFWPLYLLQFQC